MSSLDEGTLTTQPREQVLVIDDDSMVREVLRRSLTLLGYDVEVAPDGQEGLRLAATWKPAVIVLDLRMPRMTGQEFLRQSVARKLDAAIVVASGNGTMDDVIEVMRLGAIDYLKKPWTPSELLAVIGRAAAIYGQRRVGPTASTRAEVGAHGPSDRTSDRRIEMADILSRLERGESDIPSQPKIMAELRGLVADPDAAIEKVAALVERDQGLLSRVVRVAQSAHYTRLGRNADVRMMISRIGFRQLQLLVETIWAHDCFKVRDPGYRARVAEQWRFAVARALAMRALAELSHHDAFAAYLAGLFADIGISFLLRVISEQATTPSPEPGEALAFGRMAHEEVGARLLSHWGHDNATVDLARHHHRDAPPAPPSVAWSLFVVASEMAASLTQASDLTAESQWPSGALVDRCAVDLGLGPEVRRRLVERLRAEYARMLDALS